MRWHLLSLPMIAACGVDAGEAMHTARLLHFELGCPSSPVVTECPDGGMLDRTNGALAVSACADGQLLLDGTGLAVNVQCTEVRGFMEVEGDVTVQGEPCKLDLHVTSTISQECRGLFDFHPCETSWTIFGSVCGFPVDETCTNSGEFLAFADCR